MKYPIRILHVLGRLDRGGAETMVMNLYRQVDRDQIQFDFILHTTDECSYSEEVLALGGRIYAVPAYTLAAAGQYRSAWKKFFGEHPEYQILHSHIRSTASLYLPIAKKYGMTTIVHSHNTSSGKGIKAVVKSVLQYPLRFQADYLFACSKAAGEWLFGKRACESGRFVLLPNAIDISRFVFQEKTRKKARESMGVSGECLVIGHVGRLEEQKNHAFLLKIFREIHKRVPDSILLLVGEGNLKTEIEKQVTAEKLQDAVRLLGNREDVNELLQGMDVLVFPSLYEGLPVTLVEAQAAGLPVVMSDTVTREIILTDLIQQCSLQETAHLWAEKTISCREEYKFAQRGNGEQLQQLRTAGYDIEETAKWLMEFYTGLIK